LPDGASVSTAVEEREKWRLLYTVVDTLSDDEREVFDLLWIEGLSQYEAAELLGKTRNQVEILWRKVKVKIGAAWQDFAPLPCPHR
jgi:RNA polymerase sigma-70 factor (ECF subfamily)